MGFGTTARVTRGGALIVAAMAWMACAAGGGENADGKTAAEPEPVCAAGEARPCYCGEALGTQTCAEDGSSFDTCVCEPTEVLPPDPCGDGMCMPGEDCHNCAADCGQCEPCTTAPACDGVQIPPSDPTHMPALDVASMTPMGAAAIQERLANRVADAGPAMRALAAALDAPRGDEHAFVSALREVLDNRPAVRAQLSRQLRVAGIANVATYRAQHPDPVSFETPLETMDVTYPGGSEDCGAPLLRARIAKIKVHEKQDSFATDIIYCIVQAEAATAGEVRVTPPTPALDQGEEHQLTIESGVFWGQQEPTTPGSNILVTYDCIEADNTQGYQDLLDEIGQAASQIGTVIPGDSGWIFTVAGAIAPLISDALALETDDHVFNAQQVIDLETQLELTNGGYWTVRRTGPDGWDGWDWELFVEAWGCAEYGTL